MSLEWMAWTTPTAVFFAAIALMLAGMTFWETRAPTALRRGLLPMPTTRGDRFFLALVLAACVHIGWIAASEEALWAPLAGSAVLGLLLMRFG